ncbi:MAG: hypothetical protein CVU46_05530 [Chloroflexi bacterium HGW-Chloroflexi-8]|nr:MAG: hypothetical protein CVU46_05530 [Chloroflexi bacterium HGW-Chloroflexi-8]
MIKADFVIPESRLQTNIQMNVVIGQKLRNPNKEVIYKPLMCEIVTPVETRQLPLSNDNANILEIYIVKGLASKS